MLYSKYHNFKTNCSSIKRAKKTDEIACDTPYNNLDEELVILKSALKRNIPDWQQVIENWGKTIVLRMSIEFKADKSLIEIVDDWPKYLDARAAELVSIYSNIALHFILRHIYKLFILIDIIRLQVSLLWQRTTAF